MAEPTFTYGTMAAGKSTLALQLCWQLREGRSDVALWTFGDRSAEGMVTSRIGIEAAAEAVVPGSSLESPIEELLRREVKILVIDEAQFASVAQIDELARMVDDYGVDVHAFGLSADFLLNVFPASARLFAIADWAHELPLTSSCWCGQKGRCNARVINGVVARDGSQFVTGDVSEGAVHYQVLCRAHYRLGQLSAALPPTRGRQICPIPGVNDDFSALGRTCRLGRCHPTPSLAPFALTEVGEVCSSPFGRLPGVPDCSAALSPEHAHIAVSVVGVTVLRLGPEVEQRASPLHSTCGSPLHHLSTSTLRLLLAQRSSVEWMSAVQPFFRRKFR